MTEISGIERWNQRYCEGDLPWDRKSYCPNLAEILPVLRDNLPANPAALEVGCGTGTNTIYLASQGFFVTAVDIAPRAIEMAKQKAAAANIPDIELKTCDITRHPPVQDQSINFAYDRGCFHSVDPEHRETFVARIADALAPDGYWLTLCGNADERREKDEVGPPQLCATEITTTVESRFVIIELKQAQFANEDGTGHLAWRCLMQKR